MRITYRREGGAAFFPGLSGPVVIDSQQLPADESKKLESQVLKAHFFALPETMGVKPSKVRDAFEYTVTVDDGTRSHTVHFMDPVDNEDVGELLAVLQSHATAQRRRSQSKPD